jgi:lipoprotein-releasing system permease protein
MPYELFIGLRYLRAKRREAFISLITLISTAGVAIGVMTLNVVLSIMTGFEEDLRDRILGFNPHVVVWSDAGPIEDYAGMIERLREVPGVERALPFIYAHLMLITPEHVSGVLVRGILPTREGALDLAERMREGSIESLAAPLAVPEADGGERTVRLPGIILGGEIMRELGVGVGDTVGAARPFGRPARTGMLPELRRFVVAGRFQAGMPEYDSSLAYVSLADAQRLYGMGDAVSGIELRVRDIYAADRIALDVQRLLGPGYEVRDWMETNHNLFAALKLQKTAYFIVLLLIILVAAFTILATLVMVVMEKRRDIAILMSMGATRAAVGRIFVFKGLVIGLVGTLLGNLGGLLGCLALERYHFIDLPADIFLVSTVPVRMYASYFVAVTMASLIICLLATIYPARKAGRLVPVDILRYG